MLLGCVFAATLAFTRPLQHTPIAGRRRRGACCGWTAWAPLRVLYGTDKVSTVLHCLGEQLHVGYPRGVG